MCSPQRPHAENRDSAFTSGLDALDHQPSSGKSRQNIILAGNDSAPEARETGWNAAGSRGVTAYFLVGDKEVRKEKVDLATNREAGGKWLADTAGRPVPEPQPEDLDLERRVSAAESRYSLCEIYNNGN
jgi:hypothetical protein